MLTGGVEVLAEGDEYTLNKFMNEINITKGHIDVIGIEIKSELLERYKEINFKDFSVKI
jgi:acylphosphatase